MAKTKEKFHDPNQQKFANIKGFSLVAPAVFLISLFTVYPIIFTLYWAFHSGNLISPDSKYVGMNNFRYLFSTCLLYTSGQLPGSDGGDEAGFPFSDGSADTPGGERPGSG